MVKLSIGTGSVGVCNEGGSKGSGTGFTGREVVGSENKILSACSMMKSLSQDEKVLKSEGQCCWILPTKVSSVGLKSLRGKGASSASWLGEEMYPSKIDSSAGSKTISGGGNFEQSLLKCLVLW